jgi:thioredoxin reductase
LEHHVDVVIVGGGINGCGIAADAAMRGLKTLSPPKPPQAAVNSFMAVFVILNITIFL